MSLFMRYHRIFNTSNLTGVTIGAGNALPSGGYKFNPYLSVICVAPSLVFSVVFC